MLDLFKWVHSGQWNDPFSDYTMGPAKGAWSARSKVFFCFSFLFDSHVPFHFLHIEKSRLVLFGRMEYHEVKPCP
jgi:hypothetical protein